MPPLFVKNPYPPNQPPMTTIHQLLDNDAFHSWFEECSDTYQVVTTECDVVWPNNLPAKRREVTDFAPGEVAKVEFVLKMAGDDIGFGTRIFADGKSVPTRSVAKRWLP